MNSCESDLRTDGIIAGMKVEFDSKISKRSAK